MQGDPDRGGAAGPLWPAAAVCVAVSFVLITFSHFVIGELSIDDAATFFVAVQPLRDLITLPVASQGQPPLFFLALHGWLRFGDTEAVLRVLPFVFMVCAAAALLMTAWLTPATRIVSAGVLLLTGFAQYLTPTLRPYSLSVWFSVWSTLQFSLLLREPSRRASSYAWYIVATLLLAYSLTLAVWAMLAQGLCALAAFAMSAARDGVRTAAARYARLLISLAIVAALYLPHAIGFLQFQAALERPGLWVTLSAMANPRYYISGPLYLLAMPARLGYVAALLAVAGVWRGVRDRDPLVGVLVMTVAVQIAATHGLLAGRYGFSFRYLTPAYPALCLLVGLGADRLLARVRRADVAVAVLAACALAASLTSFARAPHAIAAGPWRLLADQLRRMPGTKVVFFDIGWDAQPLRYEARHDASVQLRTYDGAGWNTFGRKLTADYVAQTVDRDAAPAALLFYQLDAVLGSAVFDHAFLPAMARHHCTRVFERAVPTYVRDDAEGTGGLLVGYRCAGG